MKERNANLGMIWVELGLGWVGLGWVGLKLGLVLLGNHVEFCKVRHNHGFGFPPPRPVKDNDFSFKRPGNISGPQTERIQPLSELDAGLI